MQAGVAAAHQRSQLFVDNLDDLLLCVQTVLHLQSDAAFGRLLHKVLDDLVVDVRFQQRHAHLAHDQP